MEGTKLTDLREMIDDLDREIVALLVQRFKVTEEVGRYKAENNLKAQDSSRESEMFSRIAHLTEKYGGNSDQLVEVYRCIMDIVIERHQELRKAQ